MAKPDFGFAVIESVMFLAGIIVTGCFAPILSKIPSRKSLERISMRPSGFILWACHKIPPPQWIPSKTSRSKFCIRNPV
jgi:hypothetical protein